MEQGWSKLNILYQANPEGWLVLGVLVVIALLLCLPWRRNTTGLSHLDFSPKRRGKMLRKKRREYVEQQAIDDFVNSIEERVYHGAYSREEAKEIYRMFKNAFPRSRDLFPSGELLKEAIRHRKALNIHAPVELPDALPQLTHKPKHAFDKPVTA